MVRKRTRAKRRPRLGVLSAAVFDASRSDPLAKLTRQLLPRLGKFRFPRPLPGKRINTKRVAELLVGASLFQPLQSRTPLRRTIKHLTTLTTAASALSTDPNIPVEYRDNLESLSRDSTRWVEILTTLQRGAALLSRGKWGRPGAHVFNSLLTELVNEFRRATGSPHWKFVLQLLKTELPATFEDKTIHHLRVRVP